MRAQWSWTWSRSYRRQSIALRLAWSAPLFREPGQRPLLREPGQRPLLREPGQHRCSESLVSTAAPEACEARSLRLVGVGHFLPAAPALSGQVLHAISVPENILPMSLSTAPGAFCGIGIPEFPMKNNFDCFPQFVTLFGRPELLTQFLSSEQQILSAPVFGRLIPPSSRWCPEGVIAKRCASRAPPPKTGFRAHSSRHHGASHEYFDSSRHTEIVFPGRQ